jgi:hypothetical protein
MGREALRRPGGSQNAGWTRTGQEALAGLNSPVAIQAFLDAVEYGADPFYRSPRSILRDGRAQCFDGAVFAAAALRRLGDRPRILDMRAVNDDDHVIAIFRRGAGIGAVAKSNFVGLRYREPVFRTVRELVLSYFEDFYNVAREKTLRAYSVPLDLAAFDHLAWETDDGALEAIAGRLDSARHVEVLTPEQAARLAPVDERRYTAGLMGSNPDGLYKPKV